MRPALKILVFLLATTLIAGCKGDPKAQRDKYFASGQKYLDNKRYEEAAIEFRNALRLDGGHIKSLLGIAKAFQQMGDHQNAIGVYQQVVKVDGKNVEARLQLGQYLLAAGVRTPDLFKQAQQDAEEVLKVEPSNIEAIMLLGNAYAGQNKNDGAIAQLEKVLSLDPANLKAILSLAAAQFRKNDPVKAEQVFKEALQKHPDSPQAHLSIATFYTATQRLQDAETNYRKAFDLAPTDPLYLYPLVGYYMSAKKPAEAENVFKEAAARQPKAREPQWGLAGFYAQQGHPDQAMATLNDMLKSNQKDRQVLLRQAELYLDQKNEAKAEVNISSVLAENKNDPEAHYLMGKIQRRRQQFDKAMVEFEAAIKSNPSLSPAYLEKASLLFMRNDLDGAQNTLDAILQRDNGYLPARGALAKLLALRQKPQDALQQADQVLAALPNNEDAIAGRADALRSLGRLDDAKKEYLRLCDMQPQNPLYWHGLGTVEALKGDYTSSLSHFRKAIEVKPDLIMAINDAIYLHLRTKQYDAAMAELDRAAKLRTPQDEVHRFRGHILMAKGDLSGSEREFQKTIELNPQNYQAYIMLGQLNMQRNNIPQALKEVNQLIARNSKLAPAFLLKAFYLQLAKDVQGSMANYRKVLELDPENPYAANNLAWLLCENNMNLQEALSLARTARKKAPDDPEIADTLGWIYYKLKNHTLAVDQLLFSVNNRKQPTAENYYHLGMAYYGQGNISRAKESLKRALELNQSFPGAQDARKILTLPG
ncbi:MAG: tetratricopeptide repeat protein [Acidobacteriia bacterium]|nr:tetratricopeptide repeat protein [Terriglobia bacterium]